MNDETAKLILARNITKQMDQLGISQSELANNILDRHPHLTFAGVTAQISRVVSGMNLPNVNAMVRIARALGTDCESLLKQ